MGAVWRWWNDAGRGACSGWWRWHHCRPGLRHGCLHGHGQAHLARALRRCGETGECGVKQHAIHARVTHPNVFMNGRGFIHHGLGGGIAQHEAHGPAVQGRGLIKSPAAAYAPAATAPAVPATPAPGGKGAIKAIRRGGVVARHHASLHANLHQQAGGGVVALQADPGQRLIGQRRNRVKRRHLLRGQAVNAVGGGRRHRRHGRETLDLALHDARARAATRQRGRCAQREGKKPSTRHDEVLRGMGCSSE